MFAYLGLRFLTLNSLQFKDQIILFFIGLFRLLVPFTSTICFVKLVPIIIWNLSIYAQYKSRINFPFRYRGLDSPKLDSFKSLTGTKSWLVEKTVKAELGESQSSSAVDVWARLARNSWCDHWLEFVEYQIHFHTRICGGVLTCLLTMLLWCILSVMLVLVSDVGSQTWHPIFYSF